MDFVRMTNFKEPGLIGIPNLLEKVEQMKSKPGTALLAASDKTELRKSQAKKYEVFRKIIKQHLALSEMPGFNTKINNRQIITVELMEGASEKLINMNLWAYPEMNIDGIKFLAVAPINHDDTEIEVLLTGSNNKTTKVPVKLVQLV